MKSRGTMVAQPLLMAVLKRISGRKPFASFYVKNSIGKVVRFVDWRARK